MYQAMAVAVANRGSLDAAIAHGQNWQRIAATLPQDDRRTVKNWPLVNPMYRQGRLDELRILCEWQVQETREHPEWGMRDWHVSAFADAVSTLGLVEALQGHPQQGADLAQQAIDAARSVPELEGESWGLLRRMEIDLMMDDVEHARRLVPRLIEIDERIGSLTTRSWMHINLGRLLLHEERPDDARESLMIAEEMCSKFYRSDRSDAVTGLAQCSLALGESERAVALAEEALQEATEMGASLFALRAALTLAESLRASDAEPKLVHRALDKAESLIRQTGAVSYEPRLLDTRPR
jgi:tetratricopeptide (TPR) repeat protein